MDDLIRVDFHCHTKYSKDSLTGLEELVDTCHRKSIGRLALTDHNTIAGALIAQQVDPQLFIVGEEIMTTEGELLAFFVQEEIRPGLEPDEAISHLREQGAFISVSHPFDWMRKGHWHLPALLQIAPLVDAVEVFNARCLWPGVNHKAKAFANQHKLLGTIGSDAHHISEVGKATILMPAFHDADGLRRSLQVAARPEPRLSSAWVHFLSRSANWSKRVKKTD